MSKVFLFGVALSLTILGFSQNVNPVVLISGKVLNERNMKPVAAQIVYEYLPSGEEAGIARSNPRNGDYKIILPFGKKYGYMALVKGYYSVTKFLNVIDLKEYTEIDEQNLFLAPIQVDQVVRLNNIVFKDKSAIFTEDSFVELNRFVLFLKTNKKIEIELSAHTDNIGDSKENLELSKKRVMALNSYLTKHKIKERRLTTKWFGDTKPIGFNSSEDGRAMNRRLEFKVTSLTKSKKK